MGGGSERGGGPGGVGTDASAPAMDSRTAAVLLGYFSSMFESLVLSEIMIRSRGWFVKPFL